MHCNFGSVLTISEISILPDSLIAFFDSSLNALNDCFLSRSFWTASFCWVTCDSPNQIKNAHGFGTFHRFFRNAGDAEVNVRIVCCKIELIHGLTMFAIFLSLHYVLRFFAFGLPRAIVSLHVLFLLGYGFPRAIGRT